VVNIELELMICFLNFVFHLYDIITFLQGKTTPQKITYYIKPMKYKKINNK